MKPIIFVRHPRTPFDSTTQRIQSWDNSAKVTPAGEKASRQMAEKLAYLPVSAIISSHLDRAKGAARDIADATGAPLTLSQNFAPQKMGKYTGKNVEDVREELEDLRDNHPDDPVEGGESHADHLRRIVAGLDEARKLQKEHPDGHVIVVTHSTVERSLPHILSAGEQDILKDAPPPGTAVIANNKQGKIALERVA